MRRIFLLLTLLIISQVVSAQLYLGGFLGAAGYDGDLNSKLLKRVKPAIGGTVAYELTNRLNIRMGILLGRLEGGDEWSGTDFLKQNRNLSFTSDITELSLLGELMLFKLNKKNWTPYIFGGVALFHFNPFVRDSGDKLFLKPLSTEGQGLAEFPDRKDYSLVQASFPFGGGIRWIAKDNILISFELGLRRTTTDYLDDVSTSYVDPLVLLDKRGVKSLAYSYRADEVPGGIPGYPDNGYPGVGTQRGGEKYKDWYYIAGVHVLFRLGNLGKTPTKDKKSYGCITSPL